MGENKKRGVMLSGIQPTGNFTLGNYIGAVGNWGKQEKEFDCFYFLADLHSLTIRQDPEALRHQSYSAFSLLISCGIDPDKSVVFAQSQVPTHAEMNWILNCYSYFGELSRMHQFKEKSKLHEENINAGLLTYPVLMAGDILLYQADYVPVGADQKQHVEFARDVAGRFNSIYGPTFKLPEPYIPEEGARLMSLQDPTKKMSKSDTNPYGYVTIVEDRDTIIKKFKRAVTDNEREVVYREGKDGINNLITIYSVITGKTHDEVAKEFEGKGYGDFKTAVGEVVADELAPVRTKYLELMSDLGELDKLLKKGAQRAYEVSLPTLLDAKHKVGLLYEVLDFCKAK
ncbi:MAG: tryptophan--tRNA ligase [Mogibacterium sp.]|nr:tryptophan--tRNA ligase [Mogibacterium sp.]